MTARCPHCGRNLPLDDVNVARDVALCRACQRTYSFADLQGRRPEVDPAVPPPGAWYRPALDGFEVGASTRSPDKFFLMALLCICTGAMVWVFYATRWATGRVHHGAWLLVIPSLLMSLLCGVQAVMSLCGKVVVSIAGDAEVFTGVGSLGRTQRFAWSGIGTIRESVMIGRQGKHIPELLLEGTGSAAFGAELDHPRRYFVLHVLRRKLRERDAGSKPSAGGDWSS